VRDTLEADYPDAAPYVRDAVETHGEEGVLENYYWQLHPLGSVMAIPDREELPFYDEDVHTTTTDAEVAEMYRARAEYRENRRAASRSD